MKTLRLCCTVVAVMIVGAACSTSDETQGASGAGGSLTDGAAGLGGGGSAGAATGGKGGSGTGGYSGAAGGAGGVAGAGGTGNAAGSSGTAGAGGGPPIPDTAFFLNLSRDCYWCNQPTFVDLVKAAECFRTDWTECVDGKPGFAVDAAGWPMQVPAGAVARTVLGPIFRTGTYVVRWKGKGTFSIRSYDDAMSAPLDVVSTADGNATFTAAKRGSVALEISVTDSSDRLRDFSVIHQDLEPSASTNPFYPELLDYLKDFAGYRMMDWTGTNGSAQVAWSDRIPVYAYNVAGRFETAIQLCNQQHRDCWLNVPHKATDDYVTELATLVFSTLDPSLRVYVEYSNETWNFGFEQANYCVDEGVKRGLPGDNYEAGKRFHAVRSKEIFDIFTTVFGASAQSRMVRVVAGQSVNDWLVDVHVGQIGASSMDAYSTAPYFGYESVDGWGGQADGWSLDQLFQHLSSTDLPAAIDAMNLISGKLKGYGLPHIAYEGGQHLAGFNASAAARALYEQAQADPRFYDLYKTYFDAWKASGGRVFAYYNALSGISGQYGSWGLKPDLLTPESDAPKFRGWKDWNSANPKWW